MPRDMSKYSFCENYIRMLVLCLFWWRLLHESQSLMSVLLSAVRGADLHSYWSQVVSACEMRIKRHMFHWFKKTTTTMSFFHIFWQDLLQVAKS